MSTRPPTLPSGRRPVLQICRQTGSYMPQNSSSGGHGCHIPAVTLSLDGVTKVTDHKESAAQASDTHLKTRASLPLLLHHQRLHKYSSKSKSSNLCPNTGSAFALPRKGVRGKATGRPEPSDQLGGNLGCNYEVFPSCNQAAIAHKPINVPLPQQQSSYTLWQDFDLKPQ